MIGENAKEQLRFIFIIATEHFKQKDSVINTSAINAVTMSSMKP